MNFKLEMKYLSELFGEITRDLTLKEWRLIRTPEYWKCDKMNDYEKLKYKIHIIKKWKKDNGR